MALGFVHTPSVNTSSTSVRCHTPALLPSAGLEASRFLSLAFAIARNRSLDLELPDCLAAVSVMASSGPAFAGASAGASTVGVGAGGAGADVVSVGSVRAAA